jgi:hypothetical protein
MSAQSFDPNRPVTLDEINEALEESYLSTSWNRNKNFWRVVKKAFSNGLDFSDGNPFPAIFESMNRLGKERQEMYRQRWEKWSQDYNQQWAQGWNQSWGHGCGKKAPTQRRQIPIDEA